MASALADCPTQPRAARAHIASVHIHSDVMHGLHQSWHRHNCLYRTPRGDCSCIRQRSQPQGKASIAHKCVCWCGLRRRREHPAAADLLTTACFKTVHTSPANANAKRCVYTSTAIDRGHKKQDCQHQHCSCSNTGRAGLIATIIVHCMHTSQSTRNVVEVQTENAHDDQTDGPAMHREPQHRAASSSFKLK